MSVRYVYFKPSTRIQSNEPSDESMHDVPRIQDGSISCQGSPLFIHLYKDCRPSRKVHINSLNKSFLPLLKITKFRMAGEGVKLHGLWVSPYSRRVELALKIKGVEYEYIEEDLPNKSPELLQYNPIYKKVPVLVHNGKAIVESQVILEYIDETWKENPIIPQDPYERATARFWGKFIDEKFLPLFWKVLLGGETEVENAIEETKENLKILEKVLEGKNFFGGERIGFVDIVANVIAYWVFLMQEAAEKEVLTEEFLLLYNWKDKYVNHNIIKETLPPKDKSIAYYRAHFAQAKASS